jgi:hypothetical protein
MRMGTWMSAVTLGFLVVGCARAPEEVETEGSTEEAPKVEDQAAAPAVAERLERAIRAVDRGENLDEARAGLEAIIEDKAATADQRDEARLGLSRVLEQEGNEEAAIAVVEELLAAHWEDNKFTAREAAERRLRFLLTGRQEGPSYRLPRAKALPPAATAMAKLYEADAEGRVLVDMYIFGGPGRTRSEAFDVADAKRDEYGSLSKNGWVGQSISQSGSWVALPQAIAEKRADMPQADRSLVVFYFDLGDNRVPSRYDAYLPMPADEIAAALERGEGLVMARKREGAKPTIVIAAPRAGQLPLVEEAFAQMSELPYEAVKVPLSSKLLPEEIQARVRASWGSIRTCYEELLSRDATAEGKVMMNFVIGKDGKVEKASLGEETTLKDAKLEECILAYTRKLEFPATNESTMVRYPIAMSP